MPQKSAVPQKSAAKSKATSKTTSAKAATSRKVSAKAIKEAPKKNGAKGIRQGPSPTPKRKKVEAVPAQYGSATPHLIVSPCVEALDFYAKALGAKVLAKMEGPGGVVMHAEMKIGDSIVMLSDEMPAMPGQAVRKTPRNAGATTGGVMLYVKNVDAFVEKAVGAGATAAMPPQDMFWGDRYAQIEDPYGHVWAVATHTRDVSNKEMKKALAQMPSAEA
jgi:PhnB protein